MADFGSKRFGQASNREIEEIIRQTKPPNTDKSKKYVWNQFEQFCGERGYVLTGEIPIQQIADILKDWGVNMRKSNGDEYKEYTVKTMWNVTAKIIQDTYLREHQRSFNPFTDLEFKCARDARNAKRKQLRNIPEKRKCPSKQKAPKEHLSIKQKKNASVTDFLHVCLRSERQTDTEESDNESPSLSNKGQYHPESRVQASNVVSTRPASGYHSATSSQVKAGMPMTVRMGTSQTEMILSMSADPLIEALPSNETEICATPSTIDPLSTTERETNLTSGSVSLVYDPEKVPKEETEEVEFGDPLSAHEENSHELADYYTGDITEVLLRLQTEKLLLEIEKLKANKRKLVAERKNIDLRMQVLQLRKRLASMDIDEDQNIEETQPSIPGTSLLQVSQIAQPISQTQPTTQTILLAPQPFIIPQSSIGIVTIPYQQKVPISPAGNVVPSESAVQSRGNLEKSVSKRRKIKPKTNVPLQGSSADETSKLSADKSIDSATKRLSDVANVESPTCTGILGSLLSRDRMESQFEKSETTVPSGSQTKDVTSISGAKNESYMTESDFVDEIDCKDNIISSFVPEEDKEEECSFPKRRKLAK